MQFSHLHVHTQFSLLDGAAEIGNLYKKALKDNMPAIAITDHGNMFGAFQFVAEAYKHKNDDGSLKVKPIVGCEFYVVNDRTKRAFTKDDKDKRYHQLLLAKNAEGYQNLIKICSLGYMEGMYGKYPRIDKELILKHHKGLIATTCCLGAMVPQTILKKGEAEAEKEFKWWLDIFGEDYYVEMQRHDIKEQNIVNEVLMKFAAKYNVKVIASNDSHYVDQQDANAHDILLCVNTGSLQSTPSNKDFSDDDVSVKGRRFAFANDQFYFKTTEEMSTLFSDIPQAIDNTNEIVSKIETLDLKREVLLPNFEIPTEFQTQAQYLRHLTWEGARRRYSEVTPAIEERINFELLTIETMGFVGYFLIVMDFIKAGRDLGVFIGPGRGSAAGSVVAYCIEITNIDPIKYELLFERFLNPDRKSLPDIDTDFDDVGRQKVIDYVIQKYGRNQVAQIITYGTMAAKSSIKDVSRVLDLPLADANILAKLVPSKPGVKLVRLLHAPLDGEKSLKDKEGLEGDDIENVKKLRLIYEGTDLQSKVLKEAEKLEGSVRGTGVHAAGLIIAPCDLTDLIPVAVAKDSDLLVTQFEGKVIEDAGVIKMDFLGLKNLTILKNTLRFIKENHNIEINLEDIPLDDQKTYETIFQKGDTNAVFQFESAGMQKHLKDLKPDTFNDLVAMNALYRPGPIAYIPTYIARKHGTEKIEYDLPEMQEYLEPTYGVTVFQEQVMLLSQKIGNFTKGDADTLRKAMGKKDIKTLDKMKSKFIEGATANGHPTDKLEKIWKDWEAFAQYAFNKSHSVCYAYVAFHTAYLKTHYPAEFMAATLDNASGDIDQISFFMEECRRMGLNIFGPDVNKSEVKFSVNKEGELRFGLAAIKGVGEAAVEEIIAERKKTGTYKSIFDLTKRVSLRSVTKKTLEGLVYGGAFDCFKGTHRAQYFSANEDASIIEKAIKFSNALQANENANQQSLFGGGVSVSLPEPIIPAAETWSLMEQLKKEKEVIGIYLSGHPLDPFKVEIDKLSSHPLVELKELKALKGVELKVVGVVASANHRMSKAGKPFGSFVIEDFSGFIEIPLFGENYLNYKKYLEAGYYLYIKGRVDNRWGKEDDFEFKISSIEMLTDVREKYIKNISIEVDLERLDDKFISLIYDKIKGNDGTASINFIVTNRKEQMAISMRSSKYKVSLTNEMLQILDELGLSYKLN
ncbi:MAG: DNA polymerase III subunit alpha [Bacteroidia bacterium]|nr:DNA polymerase III subunit alpha [Bacteroidia bacterium]